jgi:OmcA/MtrC family decaheme c-type cytochrome
MQTTRTLGLLLALALAVPFGTGCKGDAGADGLQGPAGTTGATGPTGTVGPTGTAGGTTLVKTSDEAAGTNCAEGGIKIEVGVDANENGVLDATEVDASLTTYACNGDTGLPGVQTLVKTTAEPAGDNCPFGGVKIEMGPDTNGNGTLDTAEIVTALTTYACNGPAGPSSASEGLVISIKSVSTTDPVTVRFTMKDKRGYPVDKAGVYSVNHPMSMRFSFMYTTVDAGGKVLPYTVLTTSNSTSALTTFRPTAYSPDASQSSSAKTPAVGTLVENGAGTGDYTYTFPAADVAQTNLSGTPNGVLYKAIAYDAAHLNDTHTVWIEATRKTNMNNANDAKAFSAVNVDHNYIPSGSGTVVRREIVKQSNCDNCHRGFKPEADVSAGSFHGGARVDARYCEVCHNPARSVAADSQSFVHRMHDSHALQPANLFHSLKFGYPQDIRNCAACHGGAAQGAQSNSRPSKAACGSCHDYVQFAATGTTCAKPRAMTPVTTATGTASAAGTRLVLTDATKAWTANLFADGTLTITSGPNTGYACMVHANDATTLTCVNELPFAIAAGTTYSVSSRDDLKAPCKHTAGDKTDAECAGCHNAADIAGYHTPVAPPDPDSTYLGGTNANTNAAYLANAGFVPAGADVITWVIGTVSLVDASPASTTHKNPKITFKFQKNGQDVVFNTYQAGVVTELMDNFVGSPSVYFWWSLPQDGLEAPADPNASASAYVKSVWNGTISGGTATATWTDKDASGFYAITLTGTKIPIGAGAATQLYGGVGYSYNLSSSPPLVQTNVPAYPYNTGNKSGGLVVPAPNVYKLGSGFTARRTIVDNAKCKTCHAVLGATPTFHAGQRNDGPTCVVCHTPNRTSSGWSANSKDFIHAIHGGRARTELFSWHATRPGPGYGEIEFPGPINNCTSCHVSGAYDFSGTAMQAALPNMLMSTVGQGRYRGLPSQSTSYYSVSPYVDATNQTFYGYGYATSNVTVTHPTGNDGTQGATPCTLAAPCACTTANPCTTTLTTTNPVKINNVTVNCSSGCTCTTDPATGAKTACVETVKTCTTNAPCDADDTTLVKSPIVSACSGCHDSPLALSHMDMNGGSFYETRAVAKTKIEQCTLCHGPGKIAAVTDVHK